MTPATCAVCYDPLSPTEPAMVAYTETGERVSVHPACGLTLPKKPESASTMVDKPKRMVGASRNSP